MKRLTHAQYRALTAVNQGRVWLWKAGQWAKPHDVRKDTLDRLLHGHLIHLGAARNADGTLPVVLTSAGSRVLAETQREVMV
jgi:hypothetical protein